MTHRVLDFSLEKESLLPLPNSPMVWVSWSLVMLESLNWRTEETESAGGRGGDRARVDMSEAGCCFIMMEGRAVENVRVEGTGDGKRCCLNGVS